MIGANRGCCVKHQGAQDNINNGEWVDDRDHRVSTFDSDAGGLCSEKNEYKSAES